MPENFHDSSFEEIKRRIKETDKVLDIAGWHTPWNRADAVIDIMPYATRRKNYAKWTDTWPAERFTEKTYIQGDICEGFPFGDKEFDFVMCSNTLEDVRDPIQTCREIVRVAKSGFIEVPSRVSESMRGTERPFYCGWYHHRWLCEIEGTKITFQFKPAMLHAYRKFHFKRPLLKTINPKYRSIGFFWEGSFQFEERFLNERDEVQQNLVAFKKTFQDVKDLFVPKYSWRGEKL